MNTDIIKASLDQEEDIDMLIQEMKSCGNEIVHFSIQKDEEDGKYNVEITFKGNKNNLSFKTKTGERIEII